MTFFIKVISDTNAFGKIEESWDAFASNNSETPFIFSDFIGPSRNWKSQDWTPLLIIGYVNEDIVGIVPLVITQKLGMHIAAFPSPHCSLDFVIDERYREKFVDHVIDYLFEILRCKFVDLTFPAESNNVLVFQELCLKKHIFFHVDSFEGRRVLEVGCNWAQFENLKGGKFRRRFKKMKNKLDRSGSCQISCFEGEENEHYALKKIIEIEKRSWKEIWRSRKGEGMDREIVVFWEGAGCSSRRISDFKRKVWFLKLNDHPIAYALVIQNKQKATITKTSYDSRYRRFYPGIYLINAVLRDLFNSNRIRNIDFMTDMSFMGAWTDVCRERVRILAGKGILPTTTVFLYMNKQIRKISNIFMSQSLVNVAPLFG
jgi:hypothetical protein